MARCVQYFDGHRADLEHFPVFGGVSIVSRFGGRAVHDGRAGFPGQVDVARHEIGVKVSFKDVFDLHPVFFHPIQVGFGFPQGVDKRCFAVAFDVIRALSEAAGVDLFDFHVLLSLMRQR
jgi:hypothetical protein